MFGKLIMEIKYYCHNRQCSDLQKKTYALKLDKELIMDEKNIAQMFCPYCKTELSTEPNQG